MDARNASFFLAAWAAVTLTRPLAAAEEKGRPLTESETRAGQFVLKNPRLTATLMVPDQPSSAYAGPRYESGGIVMQVALDGRHTFLGKEGRGERLGGFGLIEEMGMHKAIGYEDAKPGEPFLRLGVGLVARGARPDFFFFEAFPFVERFRWDVAVAERSAAFVQVGKPFRGTAYRYEKRVVLDPEQPALRFEHALANTGEKPIETDQYCHNYFRFDDAPPGPDYVIEMEFPLEPQGKVNPPMVAEGKTVTFGELLKGAAYGRFNGQPPTASGHRFRAFHKANGLEVIVGGDFPIAFAACYADTFAVSPEAFCAIRVKPGQTFRWTRTYAFRAAPPRTEPPAKQ